MSFAAARWGASVVAAAGPSPVAVAGPPARVAVVGGGHWAAVPGACRVAAVDNDRWTPTCDLSRLHPWRSSGGRVLRRYRQLAYHAR